ncbi:MAG TPA: ATP phosphoribosyltransferase [Dongiaceae bacterium]|jgi:ATP phosphoribosyltransferase|nr:ATP phosphoribosyltransferase [Dongiaceae bacterium]
MSPLILALPRGRILDEALPVLARAEIHPGADFFDPQSRALRFATSRPDVEIIRVRAFDTATFVAYGAATLGIVGSDVLEEFAYDELYAPFDLGIGRCRLSVAEPQACAAADDPSSWSEIRIATKYPRTTRQHFAARGVQADIIDLSGAMELAPQLGLARYIVDLVASGATLKANGLVEIEKIADVSARLVVNRSLLKTEGDRLWPLLRRIGDASAHG